MEPHFIIPKELIRSLEGLTGFEAAAFEEVHLRGGQVTSIRINPIKPMAFAREEFMRGEEKGIQPVPWSSYGYYLPERPAFIFDPLLHAGAYYVQEASSMFLEQALRQTVDLSQPLRVLDLCAAPGGKSTLLQSLISADSMLVSNEVIRTRVGILRENLVKWGGANVVISQSDPRDIGKLEDYFDVVVVDAPCSGSGLFRRDPEAIREWSLANVGLCHQRQQRILSDCWPCLREGGMLLYSTCSYSREENEDVLDWMVEELQASSCKLQVKEEWGIVETIGKRGGYGYRFYPYRVKGEGFFIACLQKGSREGMDGSGAGSRGRGAGRFETPRGGSGKALIERLSRKEDSAVRGYLRDEQTVSLFRQEDDIYGMPASLEKELPLLQGSLYLKKAGICVGKAASKEFIPDHELALSNLGGPGWPRVPLGKADAIKYLRKEEIRVEGAPRGWALVSYEGHNLGWIKVLPGRINNYYPKEWRILKREL